MKNVMFKRRKGSHGLEKVVSRPFDQSHSEEDLHQFLEAEPSLIARGISEGEPIPTVVAASHLSLAAGEMDLLLLDAEGEITLTELKRGRTPREVVAQVLDYAAQVHQLGVQGLAEAGIDWASAIERLSDLSELGEDLDMDRIKLGLQNPRLLVVAFEIDESTKRISEYLRLRGVPIYCIEFEYFTDAEYEYYYPELIGADEVSRIASREETATQRVFRAIWDELLSKFKSKKPGITRREGTKDAWMSMPIGIAQAHLEWHIHRLTKQDCWLEVGLHLEHRDREKNLDALRWLEVNRARLESILGHDLLFEEWGKRWARVYARRESPAMDDTAKEWAVDTMIRFYEVVESLAVVDQLRSQGW